MKGCKTIAEILKPLLQRNPKLYFVFIGTVEKYRDRPMTDYILEQADGVRDRVLCFDPIGHDALYPVIKKARGIILPSRIDNFPNSCLEAMYYGQIVVGTKGTSLDQLIDDGLSGFLCKRDNPDSLLGEIQKVLSLSPEGRAVISKNAKSRVRLLSPEMTVEAHLKFYEEVIRRRAIQLTKENL